MSDQTEVNGVEAPEQAPTAVDESTSALYMRFQAAALELQVKNSNVADACIMLLAEALGNMTEVASLSQDDYNVVMGSVMTSLRNIAVGMSHEIATVVAEIKSGNEDNGEVVATAEEKKEELN